MYAVINSGGKQVRLSQGDFVDVERLPGQVGDQVVFGDVYFLGGESVAIGSPVVPGARVLGTIVEQKRGDKIIVFKFKRRKMYRRKQGHRQLLTRVRIDSIETNVSESESKKTKVAAGVAEAKVKAGSTAAETSAKKKTAKVAEKSTAAKKPAAKKPAAAKESAKKNDSASE